MKPFRFIFKPEFSFFDVAWIAPAIWFTKDGDLMVLGF
jgi:hypothetical protein